MKIDGTSKSNVTRTEKNKLKKVRGEGSAFSVGEDISTDNELSAVTVPQGTVSLQNLLSLQESYTLTESDRRSVKKCGKLLDDLELIRGGIIMGFFSRDALESLERTASESREQASSPELECILEEIELRAAVELAKMEVRGYQNGGTSS